MKKIQKNVEANEIRLKKILYRSWYRGCKETDKILGGYVKKHIDNLSEKQIDELEEILDLQDVDIYNWLSGKEEIPEELESNSVMQDLYDFKPSQEQLS